MKIEKCSCVYLIICRNGKRYVGATANLRKRINNHPLKKQIARVKILEHGARSVLPKLERKWINKLQPELNERPRQTGGAGLRRSSSTRRKMSAWQKGKRKGPMHPNTRKAIIAAIKGVPKSAQHRRKCGIAISKALTGKPWTAARWAAHDERYGSNATL